MTLKLFQSYKETLYLQGFGRTHPVWETLGVKGHIGIDFNFGDKDPIYAFADGEVIYADHEQGTLVLMDDEYEYSYAHLDSISVKAGDKIKAGQEIGKQGNKGLTVVSDQLSHLHFGLRKIKKENVYQGLRWNFSYYSPIKYRVLEPENGFEGHIDPAPFFQNLIPVVAKAIEKKENYKKYHAEKNNPGMIKGLDGSFLKFPSYEEGFNYLCDYLERACSGKHKAYKPDFTVLKFFEIYAPSYDRNDPYQYAKDVVGWCGLGGISDPISDWLLNEIQWLEKYNSIDVGMMWTDYSIWGQIKKQINWLWSILFKNR